MDTRARANARRELAPAQSAGAHDYLLNCLTVVASNLTLTLAPPIAPSSMVRVPARCSGVSALSLRVSSGLAVPEY